MNGDADYCVHYCEHCGRTAEEHEAQCWCGCGNSYLLPLCCPECPCGSYAEAHAVLAKEQTT